MKNEKKHRASPAGNWRALADEDLLKVRIRDLKVCIEGTPLEERIQRLYAEMESRGIVFQPPCYLTHEWLCPDKLPTIGIPFYLASQRLTQLERKMMLEAEGGTDAWCMKLLRHEAGHALNYAYRLYRKTRWRELFGPFSQRYTTEYYAEPYSKRYVLHLEDNYAQAHPDEDFAETFAVWLTPQHRWQKRYLGWPALKKLYYVDHLMEQIRGRPPLVTTRETPWCASRMRSTLEAYYERKRRYLGEDFPGFYDPGLQKIFSQKPLEIDPVKASRFLRLHRRQIVSTVAPWTGQRKFDVDKLIRKLTLRCEDMQLQVHKAEPDVMMELIAFVTAVMSNVHLFDERPAR